VTSAVNITESSVPPCRDETWKPVEPMDGCTFSGYAGSDMGHVRSVDRMSGNRRLKGKVLALRRTDDGYMLVNIRCDSTDPAHNRVHTVTVHKIVLYTFAGAPEPGQEACHSSRGPAFNWWPEGVRWDDKPANHRDQVAAGTAVVPEPSFPCRNHDRCGGMVKNQGRRCLECVIQVGQQAARMLDLGMPLGKVADHFGYTGLDWVHKLAVEHGGYTGTKSEARMQRPRRLQRVALIAYLHRVHDV